MPRRSFSRWLEFHADVPLRYVAAPCGSGKTTATVLAAHAARRESRYVRICPPGTPAAFFDAFARALEQPLDSLDALVDALPSVPCELIVDNIENADVETRVLLAQLPEELPDHVTAVYLSTARRVVDVVRGVSSGTTAFIDASLLAFEPAEIVQYCERLGVHATPADCEQLAAASDGWALAVTGAVREAASGADTLSRAFARWQARHHRVLLEIASRSLAPLTADDRACAERLYAGEALEASSHLRLIDAGLLIAAAGPTLRALRPIATALRRSVPSTPSAASQPMARADVPPASIELFGDFVLTIGGRRVEWLRRRDRQIVAFLALRADGRASRREIIATFWPEAGEQLAAQSLRTACSTIRRALARCVGGDRVPYYFTAGHDLQLHLERLDHSLRNFQAHVVQADEAFGAGDAVRARAHFVAAVRLHHAPLLESEGPAPWAAGPRAECAAAAQRASQLAEALHPRRGAASALSVEPALVTV